MSSNAALRVDPELALRAAAQRFRNRTQSDEPGAP